MYHIYTYRHVKISFNFKKLTYPSARTFLSCFISLFRQLNVFPLADNLPLAACHSLTGDMNATLVVAMPCCAVNNANTFLKWQFVLVLYSFFVRGFLCFNYLFFILYFICFYLGQYCFPFVVTNNDKSGYFLHLHTELHTWVCGTFASQAFRAYNIVTIGVEFH